MSSQKLFKDKGNMPVIRPAVNGSNTKSVEAKNTASQENDKLRYISKYLVQFVPDAKPQNKETILRISGARVLTSDKCVSILKEHEERIKKTGGKREKEITKGAIKEKRTKEEKGSSCRKEGSSCRKGGSSCRKEGFISCKEGRKRSKQSY